MFGLLYDICLHGYLLASLPKIFKNWSKYKKILPQRLGYHFPKIEKKGKKLIWIHAVSLGETKAVAPLVKKFKELSNPPLIILSTATETGHAEGLKNAANADFHLFLPLDISYLIRPIVGRVAPDAIILTETDFWYHFQNAAQKQGSRLFLINGKISERTFKRLSKLPFLAKKLLHAFDHLYIQGEIYRKRFEKLGISENRLTIIGNIKFDAEVEKCDETTLKERIGLKNVPLITLGSTHHPEERLWIGALKQLWEDLPTLKVVVVPRHPERFNEVAQLFIDEKIPFSLWSKNETFTENNLLLVDAMGVLRHCYQISTIAYVGGSMTEKVGGHNILEPSFYGKPVIFGPHMHSQPDLLDLVTNYQAGLQIKPETIVPTVKKLITDTIYRETLGKNGLALTQHSRGSLNDTFRLLQKQLNW